MVPSIAKDNTIASINDKPPKRHRRSATTNVGTASSDTPEEVDFSDPIGLAVKAEEKQQVDSSVASISPSVASSLSQPREEKAEAKAPNALKKRQREKHDSASSTALATGAALSVNKQRSCDGQIKKIGGSNPTPSHEDASLSKHDSASSTVLVQNDTSKRKQTATKQKVAKAKPSPTAERKQNDPAEEYAENEIARERERIANRNEAIRIKNKKHMEHQLQVHDIWSERIPLTKPPVSPPYFFDKKEKDYNWKISKAKSYTKQRDNGTLKRQKEKKLEREKKTTTKIPRGAKAGLEKKTTTKIPRGAKAGLRKREVLKRKFARAVKKKAWTEALAKLRESRAKEKEARAEAIAKEKEAKAPKAPKAFNYSDSIGLPVKRFREELLGRTWEATANKAIPTFISRVKCNGKDLSKYGLYLVKGAYSEATADAIYNLLDRVDDSLYRSPPSKNPDPSTRTMQIVGPYFEASIMGVPFFDNRVKLSKDMGTMGEANVYTDNSKVPKYIASGAKILHPDRKFNNKIKSYNNFGNVMDMPNNSFLCARVLEKVCGGVLEWWMDKKEVFRIRVEKGDLLIMMAKAGLNLHKCKEGQYTIVTDIVLEHCATKDAQSEDLYSKFEHTIIRFAKAASKGVATDFMDPLVTTDIFVP